MRSRLFSATVACTALATMTSAVTAQQADRLGYYDKSREGWFWYQDPPEKKEPEEDITVPPPLMPAPEEPEAQDTEMPPATVATTPQMPAVGSVEFLREAMPKALDIATDNPTRENVERYLILQKMAIDKSEMFSEMSKMVSTGHPLLDEGRRRPKQDTFAKKLEEEAEVKKREVLSEFFKRNALIMFLDNRCSGCAMMAENFYRMQQTHGLVWQSISLDGTLLPDNLSSNQSFNAGIAERLGVDAGGAVFIASPPSTYIPVTWNPTGGAEIADRILLVAARSGLITDEVFRQTQAINPMIGSAPTVKEQELPPILQAADQFIKPEAITINGMENNQ
ncbi:hypothetical protein D2T29_12200 [Sinirhodobacter populi]|uniref:Conjugal transfer protein TraF n=1 Tax=Paenirhodobacter populi TaxID=2306993 RepID=A0A443KCB8_9RHOB|nr:conjugal transfer protein TraF [Sinirhodobacter populi]RWR30428.1 hypothetical protein D2T29_12200 [Sinirhodobacter populi]